MRRRGDEDGDLIFIILGVFLAMMLLATLDAEGQDLDSGFRAGYAEWWDSPQRARWLRSRGIAPPGAPKVPPVAETPQEAPQAVLGAGSWDAMLAIMRALPEGTCRYVEWGGAVRLAKANMTWPAVRSADPAARAWHEKLHCRYGVLG